MTRRRVRHEAGGAKPNFPSSMKNNETARQQFRELPVALVPDPIRGSRFCITCFSHSGPKLSVRRLAADHNSGSVQDFRKPVPRPRFCIAVCCRICKTGPLRQLEYRTQLFQRQGVPSIPGCRASRAFASKSAKSGFPMQNPFWPQNRPLKSPDICFRRVARMVCVSPNWAGIS